MKTRFYATSQTIARPREEVFAFFATPRNLEAITPPWLRFRIVGQTTDDVQLDTEFTYRLRLRGIPLKWVSRISDWVPGERFVDEQVRGPYALWRHTHTFEDVPRGTLIRDRVVYRLPLGPVGDWLAGRFVASDVSRIFDYRRQRTAGLLSASGSQGMPVE